VFLDFYVVALCNLGFAICGLYMEQVWPTLFYVFRDSIYIFILGLSLSEGCPKRRCKSLAWSHITFDRKSCWHSFIKIVV